MCDGFFKAPLGDRGLLWPCQAAVTPIKTVQIPLLLSLHLSLSVSTDYTPKHRWHVQTSPLLKKWHQHQYLLLKSNVCVCAIKYVN